MSRDMSPRKAPPGRKSAGGTLFGLFIGLVLGVIAVAAVVWYGQPFEIVVYFRALAPLDRPWKVFVHVDSVRDRARHLADHEPLNGECPTAAWQPGDLLVDRVTTTIRDTLPAGSYAMWIGFYTGWPPRWRNLEVHTAPAAMWDPAYERIKITELTVE